MPQVVIVTGGAGGIGSSICTGLVGDGHKVVIADYAGHGAERLANDLGAEALAVQVDVSCKGSVEQLVETTLGHFGTIDVLLNGAGIMPRHPVNDITEEEWDRVLGTNLKGVFLCSQAVARHMVKKEKGRILSIASGRGVAGAPNAAHYAASKGGVIAFTKSLAAELAPRRILVNALAPGRTDTPMSRAGTSDEAWKRRKVMSPLQGALHRWRKSSDSSGI